MSNVQKLSISRSFDSVLGPLVCPNSVMTNVQSKKVIGTLYICAYSWTGRCDLSFKGPVKRPIFLRICTLLLTIRFQNFIECLTLLPNVGHHEWHYNATNWD